MRYRYFAMMLMLTITLFLFGCVATKSVGEEEAAQTLEEFLKGTILLKSGEVVDVKVGDILTVILETNPSTGYSWEVAIDPVDSLTEETKRYFSKSDKKLMGAPKTAVWKFSANSEGDATLNFRYLRSWEGEEGIIKTMVFKVRVAK
jgi:predicted secreted protein